jgi:hypothetical protein
MAIIQVSRITQRKGLQEDLPQLAGAEFGWAIDQQRLYIGNGTLAEGAPTVGNTEILTQYSDILGLAGSYTYQGAAAGYVVQTGPSPSDPVSLTLQQTLDQWVSVKSFGAKGDGIANDTDAINRALYQLYCRDNNPEIRRSLFFPAGVYKITESIIIPPYATLYGEGALNSIIQMSASPDDSSLRAYVARLGDNYQNIGVNIGSVPGSVTPTHVTVKDLGFQSLDEDVSIFLIEDANLCSFEDVSFIGALTAGNLTSAGAEISCVSFNSSVSLVSNNIVFRRCYFSGTNYGIFNDREIQSISVSDSDFDTLYQGIRLLDDSGDSSTGFRIVRNSFNNIYVEGIYTGSDVSLTASSQNIFLDVGNHFLGTANPFTSVINFSSANNISIGDLFERTPDFSTVFPRIQINDLASIAMENADTTKFGTYIRESGVKIDILDNQTNTAIFTFDASLIKAMKVDYTIIRGNTVRTGSFVIVASTDGTGGNLATSDTTATQNSSTGVTLSAVESSSTVTFRYSSTSIATAGIMRYSVQRLG